MEDHKNYAGLKNKDFKKPRIKKLVDAYGPSTAQVTVRNTSLPSLTSTDAAEGHRAYVQTSMSGRVDAL